MRRAGLKSVDSALTRSGRNAADNVLDYYNYASGPRTQKRLFVGGVAALTLALATVVGWGANYRPGSLAYDLFHPGWREAQSVMQAPMDKAPFDDKSPILPVKPESPVPGSDVQGASDSEVSAETSLMRNVLGRPSISYESNIVHTHVSRAPGSIDVALSSPGGLEATHLQLEIDGNRYVVPIEGGHANIDGALSGMLSGRSVVKAAVLSHRPDSGNGRITYNASFNLQLPAAKVVSVTGSMLSLDSLIPEDAPGTLILNIPRVDSSAYHSSNDGWRPTPNLEAVLSGLRSRSFVDQKITYNLKRTDDDVLVSINPLGEAREQYRPTHLMLYFLDEKMLVAMEDGVARLSLNMDDRIQQEGGVTMAVTGIDGSHYDQYASFALNI